jgi:hypothetical protein
MRYHILKALVGLTLIQPLRPALSPLWPLFCTVM